MLGKMTKLPKSSFLRHPHFLIFIFLPSWYDFYFTLPLSKNLIIALCIAHLCVYNLPLHIKLRFDTMNILGVVVHLINFKQLKVGLQ